MKKIIFLFYTLIALNQVVSDVDFSFFLLEDTSFLLKDTIASTSSSAEREDPVKINKKVLHDLCSYLESGRKVKKVFLQKSYGSSRFAEDDEWRRACL